nr:unnamed protein product [Callosobruchus analis]
MVRLRFKREKGAIIKPACFTKHRGVDIERKENSVSKLEATIPQNRMKFWEELVTPEATNADIEYESYSTSVL